MTRINNQKMLRLKAIFICVVAFVLSVCLSFLTACTTEDEQVFVNTSSDTDTQKITNGNFEFYDTNGGYDVIMTAKGWSSATGTVGGSSADSSSSKSGIIYTGNSYKNNKGELERGWDYLTADKDATSDYYQKSLRGVLASEETDEDGELISSKYNVDEDDIPTIANPKTHTGEDGHVLMIHNQKDGVNRTGTAQYYTSSTTVTLPAHTSAMVSVWVYTADLTYGASKEVDGVTSGSYKVGYDYNYETGEIKTDASGEIKADSEQGAYIALKQTVAGETLDNFMIKNINTYGEWQKYEIAIKGSNFNESTFVIVLGLGQQPASNNYAEYVNGYAFFDDVQCSIVENSVVDAFKDADTFECKYNDTKTDKILNCGVLTETRKKVFINSQNENFTKKEIGTDIIATTDLTKEISGGNTYTTDNYVGLGFDKTGDVTGVFTNDELAGTTITSNYYTAKVKEELTTRPAFFDTDAKTVLLLSSKGTAYTTRLTSNDFKLQENEQMAISFWCKTSSVDTFTGATVTLIDYQTKTSISNIDTTTIEKVSIDSNDDVLEGWTQFVIFVKNVISSEVTFELELSFGPTTIVGSKKAEYHEGYAAFTNFELAPLTKTEYDYLTSTTTTKTISVFGELGVDILAYGFDNITYTDLNNKVIRETIANLRSFYGVNANSEFINGVNAGDTAINSKDWAGLINKYYEANYYNLKGTDEGAWLEYILQKAEVDGVYDSAADGSNWWDKVVGQYNSMPLIILTGNQEYIEAESFQTGITYYTFSGGSYVSAGAITEFAEGVTYYYLPEEATGYGYISNDTSTLSADSYTTLSYDVYVSSGAVAYVYLIDAEETGSYKDKVSIETSKLSYWYDVDGNVYYPYDVSGNYVGDDDEFDSEGYIVYWMQANGLHKDKDGNYFANLSVYDTDEKGNKITSNDEIVFYYNEADNTYYYKYSYSTKKYSMPVNDFNNEYAKSAGTTNELFVRIDGNDPAYANKWTTVNFYIVTGNTAKTYRLEVWNGARDNSEVSEFGSYVFFMKNTTDSLTDDNYTSLLDFAKEYICDNSSFAIDDLDEFYGKYFETKKAEIKANGGIDVNGDGILDFIDKDKDGYIEGLDFNGDGIVDIIYNTYNLYDDIDYVRFDEDEADTDEANPYKDYSQDNYTSKISYLKIAKDNSISTYVDFSSIDVTIDASADTDTDTSDDDSDDSSLSVGLLITSIAVAVVLIVTLLLILIRDIVKRARRSKKVKNSKYTSRRKHYVQEAEYDDDGDYQDDDFDDDVTDEELYAGNKEETTEEVEIPVEEEKTENEETEMEDTSKKEDK